MSLSATSNMSPDGGNGTLAITTQPECAWDVSSTVEWITDVAPKAGQGNGSVAFRVARNTTADPREGELLVNDTRARIAQRPAPCEFILRPLSQGVSSEGDDRQIEISALQGCNWTASVDASWITFDGPSGGRGDGTLRFDVARNREDQTRVATITIGGERATVTQTAAGVAPPADPALPPTNPTPPGPGCTHELGLTSQFVGAAAGAGTVSVTTGSNCSWTAASNAGWLAITAGASSRGSGTVGFSFTTNTGSGRAGTLTIAGQTFTVNQAAATAAPPQPPAPSCTYSISPTSVSSPALGDSGSVSVSTASGCAWTAASNANWIAVTSGASSSGSGSAGYVVAPNLGGARSGTLTVAGRTYTVSQAAVAQTCTYSISPSSASVGATGGSGSTSVTAGSGCAWTASANAGWLSVTSGASGSGNGSVTFSAAANTGGARTGTLTVAGQTLTVSQAAAAPACTYSISPSSQSVPASGGSGSTSVTAGSGCAWTAGANAGWLSITSGASGSGNGSVSFSAAANTGGARSGTLTVAGQTFTVSQAAAPSCSYSISPNSADFNAAGGTGSISVNTATGCPWTAGSNDSWIAITSGASGSGPGTVQYSVASHSGNNDRRGSITVAGRNFRIDQEEDD